MKKILLLLLITGRVGYSQADEAKQLLLNVEKLAQFKSILKNMKEGYQELHKGYTSINNISQGSFSLHKTFLDGLLQVSPVVKNYKRVADIIQYQLKIVKECKAALRQFREDKQFTVPEITNLGQVYANLFSESIKNIDELSLVLIPGKLRMSDDERLQAIDRIYADITQQYTFLNAFNNSTAILSLQREKEGKDIDLMKKVHGIK